MFFISAVFLSALSFIASVVARNSVYVYTPADNVSTITIQLSPGVPAFNDSSNDFDVPPVTQRLSYYVHNGLTIVDGDVIFGTEDELLSLATGEHNKHAAESESHAGDIQKRSLSIFPVIGNKWPGGTIRYNYESQATKDLRIADWTEAIKRWTDRLPFLKFVEATDPDPILFHGIVTIQNNPGLTSSHSPIGKSKSAASNLIALGDSGPGVYAHEIGHTLGLSHGHNARTATPTWTSSAPTSQTLQTVSPLSAILLVKA